MKIKQLSIFLENKTGSLVEILDIIADANINLRAISLADATDFGILRIVVDDYEKCIKVLEEHNYIVKTSVIVGLFMEDSPSGLASTLKVLKEENIDLEYFYAVPFKRGENAILFLHTEDLDNLVDVLNKNNIELFSLPDN